MTISPTAMPKRKTVTPKIINGKTCAHTVIVGGVWCFSCANDVLQKAQKDYDRHVKSLKKAGRPVFEGTTGNALPAVKVAMEEVNLTPEGIKSFDVDFYKAIYAGNFAKAYSINDNVNDLRRKRELRNTDPLKVPDTNPIPTYATRPVQIIEKMFSLEDLDIELPASFFLKIPKGRSTKDYTMRLTRHAKDRMKTRNISLEIMNRLFKDPITLRQDTRGAYEITDGKDLVIIGAFEETSEEKSFWVITTYRTSDSL